jgi:choline dehydrogenase-like flavoprotein
MTSEADDIHPIIVVGSGPAGVAAAWACARKGVVPTILDVGITPSTEPPEIPENFYDFAEKHSTFELLIGRDYSGLYNLNPSNPHISFLLTVPKYAFVRAQADELLPVDQERISIVRSLAKGGLANAWGAAAYRYIDRDLEGWPIRAAELDPYYDLLTREIGINGAEDDLTPFYGSASGLQPAIRLGINSQRILERYSARKIWFNRRGVFVGRMRSAVLTEPLDGREPYPYRNSEAYARLTCFYNPVYTLEKLIRSDQARYLPGYLVERFRVESEKVEVVCRNVHTGIPSRFYARALILAAGAVNSAKIVLASFEDYQTILPLYDNPAVYVPSFLLGRIGKALDVSGYGFATLAILYQWPEYPPFVQGLVFETMNVPRAEFFRHMPFCVSTGLTFTKYVLPAMVVVILYFPSTALPPARVRLRSDGVLELRGPEEKIPQRIIRRALRVNRRLGLYGFSFLAERSIYGGSIHYAGCLPMRENPRGRYECDRFGRLLAADRVWVADGAVLPSLSAKNHTLTLMANAMRVAEHATEMYRNR